MPLGSLTVSLDFELHWGTRDLESLNECKVRILGGRGAIPRILALFKTYEVHATWATVGFLFFRNKADLEKRLPSRIPAYADAGLNPYPLIPNLGTAALPEDCYFACDLIREIAGHPGQEIGTHTFSHFYCLEEGASREDFLADLEAAQLQATEILGRPLRSLVFPRNQYTKEYLVACLQNGIQAYRGNQDSWVYSPQKFHNQGLLRRGVRLLDCYFNLTGHHGHQLENIPGLPINIPASRFLRPVSRKLGILEPLRLRRIRKDLTYCAQKGLLYHLWWHPDNFGIDTDENCDFLERVLVHFAELRDRYGMQSRNMGELADQQSG